MHTQMETAKIARAEGADYVLQLRDNQKCLHNEVKAYFHKISVHELSRTIRHHWVLDITFRENESQIHAEDGAKNLPLFRRALLNFIKAHPMKDSVAGKRQRAYWHDKFRAEILFG